MCLIHGFCLLKHFLGTDCKLLRPPLWLFFKFLFRYNYCFPTFDSCSRCLVDFFESHFFSQSFVKEYDSTFGRVELDLIHVVDGKRLLNFFPKNPT